MTTVTIQIDASPKTSQWITEAIAGYLRVIEESTEATIRVSTRSVSIGNEPPPAPQLLAVIRRESTGREIVVVERGGEPVHISEVLPEVLEKLSPEKPAA